MNMGQKFLKGLGKMVNFPFASSPNMNSYNPWMIDESDGVKRKAVYTSAFWLAPPFGRPRDIDYERLEPLEKNAWIRMCTQHIVDSIAGAEFNIVPRDKGKEVSDATLGEARDFFEGDWQENWQTNLRMMLPDLLHYDCGVTIKAFPVTAYEETGELKEKASDKMKPVELYSRDGRSFMKDTGLAGRLRQYWQYSWINPQGMPIRFSPEEIMYYQVNPSSRSPYGTANLEVVEFIVDYMIESAVAQSKYWKNGMFIGGQIDLPEIKDIDELKRQQAYYEAKLRGSKKMNKWLVTGGGATVKSIPFTPQQMQWVESQKWFAKIIFGIYKVTPSELGFCHSEDTEFLTNDGWKLYDNIKKGEKVGTYNKETGKLEFQEPVKHYHYHYSGEMVHFDGRSIDALITPNHRMFVQPYDYKEWRIVEAKDVSWSQFHFKQACGWEGERLDFIKVPIPKSKKHDTVKRKELIWEANSFLEFLGWFVSEGCVTNYGRDKGQSRIDISQNEGENADRIRNVLFKLDIKFLEYTNKKGNVAFIIQNKQIYEFIKPMKDKLPEWIFELPSEQLEIFLDPLCRGDGHLCNKKNSRFEFYTTKKVIADQTHEIALKCGYRTTLSLKKQKNKNWKDLHILYMSKYTDKAYLEQSNIKREHYEGFVNCFAVPNGFLVTRRNGKILISHNTEDLNKATGIQQMEIHKSKAIRPLLILIEDMVNRQVVWKHFSKDVKFEFVKTLSLDEKTKQTEIDVKRLDKGLDSVNALRDRDGLEKWENEKWDKPIGDEEEQPEEDDFDWDFYFNEEEPEETEKMFSKGGKGSGVRGHTTYHGQMVEKGLQSLTPELKGRLKEIRTGGSDEQKEQFIEDVVMLGIQLSKKERKGKERSKEQQEILDKIKKNKEERLDKEIKNLKKLSEGEVKEEEIKESLTKILESKKKLEAFKEEEKKLKSKVPKKKASKWGKEFKRVSEDYAEEIFQTNKEMERDVRKTIKDFSKAANVGAVSGESGFVPMPEVYDGMDKPIKTKKNEKKIIDLVSGMYKEIQEEVNEEWDRLFGE